MEVINIQEKFNRFDDHWTPRLIAELNGQELKLAKFKGEFVWHSHAHADELFWVVKGVLEIAFHDGVKTLREGEMLVVPKGVEHKPIASEEAWVMLFEPKGTVNTGDNPGDKTRDTIETI